MSETCHFPEPVTGHGVLNATEDSPATPSPKTFQIEHDVSPGFTFGPAGNRSKQTYDRPRKHKPQCSGRLEDHGPSVSQAVLDTDNDVPVADDVCSKGDRILLKTSSSQLVHGVADETNALPSIRAFARITKDVPVARVVEQIFLPSDARTLGSQRRKVMSEPAPVSPDSDKTIAEASPPASHTMVEETGIVVSEDLLAIRLNEHDHEESDFLRVCHGFQHSQSLHEPIAEDNIAAGESTERQLTQCRTKPAVSEVQSSLCRSQEAGQLNDMSMVQLERQQSRSSHVDCQYVSADGTQVESPEPVAQHPARENRTMQMLCNYVALAIAEQNEHCVTSQQLQHCESVLNDAGHEINELRSRVEKQEICLRSFRDKTKELSREKQAYMEQLKLREDKIQELTVSYKRAKAKLKLAQDYDKTLSEEIATLKKQKTNDAKTIIDVTCLAQIRQTELDQRVKELLELKSGNFTLKALLAKQADEARAGFSQNVSQQISAAFEAQVDTRSLQKRLQSLEIENAKIAESFKYESAQLLNLRDENAALRSQAEQHILRICRLEVSLDKEKSSSQSATEELTKFKTLQLELESALVIAQNAIDDLKIKGDASHSQSKEVERELTLELCNSKQETANVIQSLHSANNQIKTCQETLQKRSDELRDEQLNNHRLLARVNELEDAITTKDEIDRVQRNKLCAEMNSLETQVQTLNNLNFEVQAKHSILEKELEGRSASLTSMQTSLEASLRNEKSLMSQMDAYRHQADDLEKERNLLKCSITQLHTERSSLGQQICASTEECRTLKREKQEIEFHLNTLRDENSEYEIEADSIRATQHNLKIGIEALAVTIATIAKMGDADKFETIRAIERLDQSLVEKVALDDRFSELSAAYKESQAKSDVIDDVLAEKVALEKKYSDFCAVHAKEMEVQRNLLNKILAENVGLSDNLSSLDAAYAEHLQAKSMALERTQAENSALEEKLSNLSDAHAKETQAKSEILNGMLTEKAVLEESITTLQTTYAKETRANSDVLSTILAEKVALEKKCSDLSTAYANASQGKSNMVTRLKSVETRTHQVATSFETMKVEMDRIEHIRARDAVEGHTQMELQTQQTLDTLKDYKDLRNENVRMKATIESFNKSALFPPEAFTTALLESTPMASSYTHRRVLDDNGEEMILDTLDAQLQYPSGTNMNISPVIKPRTEIASRTRSLSSVIAGRVSFLEVKSVSKTKSSTTWTSDNKYGHNNEHVTTQEADVHTVTGSSSPLSPPPASEAEYSDEDALMPSSLERTKKNRQKAGTKARAGKSVDIQAVYRASPRREPPARSSKPGKSILKATTAKDLGCSDRWSKHGSQSSIGETGRMHGSSDQRSSGKQSDNARDNVSENTSPYARIVSSAPLEARMSSKANQAIGVGSPLARVDAQTANQKKRKVSSTLPVSHPFSKRPKF